MNSVRTSGKGLLAFIVVIGLAAGLAVTAFTPSQAKAEDQASAAEDPVAEAMRVLNEKFAKQELSRKGADTCMRCHDAESDIDASPIFFTSHGRMEIEHGPMQLGQCEACHGPDGDHSKSRLRRGQTREPMVSFGRHAIVPADKQNEMCLNCHVNDHDGIWLGSEHDQSAVSCASCHKVHQRIDPVQVRDSQPQVCMQCHQKVNADIHKRSNHPVKWDQLQCSDCHQSHGSFNDSLLIGETLNDSCFACHAEKRGPFLWEHEPVSDDCSNCHTPHGSINKALLKQRVPQLCQQCHSGSIHTSDNFGLSMGVASSSRIAGKSCLNCHSMVHGSNHPSGSLLER